MRSFVAIDLPDEARDALERVQERIPVGRITDPENLHLTLAFLGDQPQAALEELHMQLETIRSVPFELRLRGLGTFGNRDPRVIWAGVEPEPALSILRDKVRSAARVAGIDLPRERFRPHVTLARLGDRIEPGELEKLRLFLEKWQSFPVPAFEVEGFTLFQSMLHKDGAVHDPLAEYSFR